MKETKSIAEYGIVNFLIQVQEGFDQGYRIDVETNENCPTSFGAMFVCNMVKENKDAKKSDKGNQVQANDAAIESGDTTIQTQEEVKEEEVIVPAVVEVQQAQPKGRKAK
jgi:uncharacterized membrane protein YfhO